MLRVRVTLAAGGGLLPAAKAAISWRISASAGPVLSICTGALAIHGRWPTELVALLRAPYDQCLSSRRFMFRREVKSPPITPLAMSKRVELAEIGRAHV